MEERSKGKPGTVRDYSSPSLFFSRLYRTLVCTVHTLPGLHLGVSPSDYRCHRHTFGVGFKGLGSSDTRSGRGLSSVHSPSQDVVSGLTPTLNTVFPERRPTSKTRSPLPPTPCDGSLVWGGPGARAQSGHDREGTAEDRRRWRGRGTTWTSGGFPPGYLDDFRFRRGSPVMWG